MPLFIDRLPFACWIDRTRVPAREHWSVVLPVIVSESRLPAPLPNTSVQQWVLDTGTRSAAFAWRQHLLDAGLNPDVNQYPVGMNVTTFVGGKIAVPVREADLWLVSNLPATFGAVFRISLAPGILFHNVSVLPDPQFHRPMIGLKAMREAGLRVEIDFAADVVSVWTP